VLFHVMQNYFNPSRESKEFASLDLNAKERKFTVLIFTWPAQTCSCRDFKPTFVLSLCFL
jgi:hypothetical protein